MSMQETDLREFDAAYEPIIRRVVKYYQEKPEHVTDLNVLNDIIDYTVKGGTRRTGLLAVEAYKRLAPSISTSDMQVARVLGWCSEILLATVITYNDVLEANTMRRGKICYYKQDGVDKRVYNDVAFLNIVIYDVLIMEAKEHPQYDKFSKLFHQMCFHVFMGDTVDSRVMKKINGKVDVSRFTMEKFDSVSRWRHGLMRLYTPILAAMTLVGIHDEATLEETRTLSMEIGAYLMAQEDYVRTFSENKPYCDYSRDGIYSKNTWFIAKALEIASPAQKLIIQESFDLDSEGQKAKVVPIFKELSLSTIYAVYAEKTFKDLITKIQNAGKLVPKDILTDIVKEIYVNKTF